MDKPNQTATQTNISNSAIKTNQNIQTSIKHIINHKVNKPPNNKQTPNQTETHPTQTTKLIKTNTPNKTNTPTNKSKTSKSTAKHPANNQVKSSTNQQQTQHASPTHKRIEHPNYFNKQ